jgi:hypothetical protein
MRMFRLGNLLFRDTRTHMLWSDHLCSLDSFPVPKVRSFREDNAATRLQSPYSSCRLSLLETFKLCRVVISTIGPGMRARELWLKSSPVRRW